MIASYTKNFIFLKSKKTAGTSVEIVLSSWCSGRDICTPIAAEDEIIRREYGGAPRNFCENVDVARAFLEATATGDVEAIRASRRRVRESETFRPHCSAKAARRGLPDLWDGAFRFTVSRHPYEVAISQAYWSLGRRYGGDQSKWDEILNGIIETGSFANHELYAQGGELLVHKVLRFDDLWSGIASVAQQLGEELPEAPPRAKTGYRLDSRPASEMLTKDQKRRIVEAAKFEFELMNYQT